MANNINGASLNPIYQRLHDAPQYHPLEADTFADWAMEAGDIVTVSRDGKSYESPVHSSTVTWKKGQQVTVSSTGQEKRDSVTKMSQKKYNRGSSGLRNSENRYQQIVTSYNEMTAGLILASSSAALYVNNKYTQMQSGLFLTESSAHLYTNNRYTQMQSGLKLSESSAHLYVDNKYSQMSAGLKLTSSSAALYVNNKYSQMQSGLYLTESSSHLYTNNKYTQMSSGLKLTESSAHLYTNNKYTQMSSGLKLSESSAHLYVDNKYSQMTAGLKLSESSAHLYVNNKYTQMTSGLKLSESSAHLYTNNKYTQMSSGLKLTESSAHLYTNNKYTQMSSGLKLSESSARLYVDSKYAQMQAGLDVTMSSATLYAKNRTTRAYIMTRINADGEGEALIEASKVKISGDTTLSGMLTIQDGALFVKNKLVVSSSYSGNMKVLNIGADGKITFADSGGNIGTQTLNVEKVSNLITGLKVVSSGNNYKLQAKTVDKPSTWTDIPDTTFSRAVSSFVWGGGSGKINVTALPQNQTQPVKVSVDGNSSITTNGDYTYKVMYENGDGDDVETGASMTVTVNVPAEEHTHHFSITRASWHSVSGTVYKGKLYYWDDDTEDYEKVINQDKYWYYSDTNKSGTTTVYY